MAIVLVRFRESFESETSVLKSDVKYLTKELLIRLPQRPYGVANGDNFIN